MQTPATSGTRLRFQEYDRISIPEDVPALGIEEGDEGVIRGLQLDNETILALVAIAYSTGRPRGDGGDQTVQEGPFLHDRLIINLRGRFANRPRNEPHR